MLSSLLEVGPIEGVREVLMQVTEHPDQVIACRGSMPTRRTLTSEA